MIMTVTNLNYQHHKFANCLYTLIHKNGRNPNENVQLSVAYLGPLPTLNSHNERNQTKSGTSV